MVSSENNRLMRMLGHFRKMHFLCDINEPDNLLQARKLPNSLAASELNNGLFLFTIAQANFSAGEIIYI